VSLAAGTRLGPYEILAPIGAGGMGEVYRARDTRLGRDVAIKVLPGQMATDPEALARFEREARAVAALNHPHILSLFDVGRQDGTAYAVTELLEGATLRDQLKAGALPVRKAVEYAIQIAQALAAVHAKGIVHRDLKPDNVFVTRDGGVKLLDFGLAAQSGGGVPEDPDDTTSPTRSRHTDPGTILGTAGYMAPEQVRGQAADHRADVFAFGCTMFRDADRCAGLQTGHRGRNDDGDPEGRPRMARGQRRGRAAGSRAARRSLPREITRRALPVGAGPRLRPPELSRCVRRAHRRGRAGTPERRLA